MARTDPSEAVAHLRAGDPVLAGLIDQIGTDWLSGRAHRRRPGTDRYGVLVRTIIGQQLSTRSAEAIYGRVIERFGGRPPTPDEILADDPEDLRTAAGLSHAKVKYLRSLAEHVVDGSLQLNRLARLSDERVTAELTSVKGIGEWSADMFLMFTLNRPDVLAVGDLGIRRAVMLAYELPTMPAPEQVRQIAEPWRPYRTLACEFLWRSLNVTPV